MGTHEDEPSAASIAREFSSAPLGDARRSQRLVALAEACARAPEHTLPRALGTPKALKAGYRFLSHDAVTPSAMLQPHFAQTALRMVETPTVVVAHDTTEFEWSTDREGLGYLRKDDHGFLAHVSLAITADPKRRPLGVAGLHTWTRQGESRARTMTKTERRAREDKESSRWFSQVEVVHKRFGEHAALVHVMDREGDAFPLLNAMCEAGHRFVIRLARDRIVREDETCVREKMSTLVSRAEHVFDMEVPLSARRQKGTALPRKSLMPRDARMATLGVQATRAEVKKPPYVKDAPGWLELNVVRVREVDAPADATPVEWTLLTTEPVDTLAEVCAVVEHYRARWLIEELFKAVKTGCEYEELQLESYDALINALAMFLPIAWRMLFLRCIERTESNAPASLVATPTEIDVLRFFGPKTFPRAPTVRDVLLVIAGMGGYMKNKKPPGWLVLARGLEKLTLLEAGWSGATKHPRTNVGDP